jgi:SH3-like domain-containing protein
MLSMLPENTQVNVLALDDSQEWAQIKAADGATGWVSTKFLVDVLST